MRYLLILVISLSSSVIADEAFPLARRGGLQNNLWTNAGVIGGIPERTDIYTNIALGTTLAGVNTAIINAAAAGSNKVVKLASGGFDWNGFLYLTQHGITVRGTTNTQGIPITYLTNTCPLTQSNQFYLPANFAECTHINVSSGASEGSTSIVLASAPSSDYQVGNIMLITMLTNTAIGIHDDSNDTTFGRDSRPYSMPVLITGISGSTITFTPPLLGTNWTSASDIEATAWYSTQGTTYHRTGLEDVEIIASANEQSATGLWNTYECWFKNVKGRPDRTKNSNGYLMMGWSVRSEIRNCWLYDGIVNASSDNPYCILAVHSSYARIENNSFTNNGEGITIVAMTGSSISYNVGLGPFPYNPSTWLVSFIGDHGGHSHHNCYEGNWIPNIKFDTVFGQSNGECGIIRNRLAGWASGKTGDTFPVVIGESGKVSRKESHTILGNVVGSAEHHTLYSQMFSFQSGTAVTNAIKTNNWNTVDSGVNSAESIGSNTMLDSYVMAGKPAYWGSAQPWPWIPLQSSSTNSTYYTNSPAGYRLYYGEWPSSAAGAPAATPKAIFLGPVTFGGSVTIQ